MAGDVDQAEDEAIRRYELVREVGSAVSARIVDLLQIGRETERQRLLSILEASRLAGVIALEAAEAIPGGGAELAGVLTRLDAVEVELAMLLERVTE